MIDPFLHLLNKNKVRSKSKKRLGKIKSKAVRLKPIKKKKNSETEKQ